MFWGKNRTEPQNKYQNWIEPKKIWTIPVLLYGEMELEVIIHFDICNVSWRIVGLWRFRNFRFGLGFGFDVSVFGLAQFSLCKLLNLNLFTTSIYQSENNIIILTFIPRYNNSIQIFTNKIKYCSLYPYCHSSMSRCIHSIQCSCTLGTESKCGTKDRSTEPRTKPRSINIFSTPHSLRG